MRCPSLLKTKSGVETPVDFTGCINWFSKCLIKLTFCCSRAFVKTVENKDTAPSVDNSVFDVLSLLLDGLKSSWSEPVSDIINVN